MKKKIRINNVKKLLKELYQFDSKRTSLDQMFPPKEKRHIEVEKELRKIGFLDSNGYVTSNFGSYVEKENKLTIKQIEELGQWYATNFT